tara:strand:+ start:3308 stop:4048 length:741 start_codon:yes stop_codon:yes gene_type:complete
MRRVVIAIAVAIVVTFVAALTPFAHNLWEGRMRRSANARILRVRCDDIQQSLRPHIPKIVQTMRRHGARLDPSFNFHMSQGCKAARSVYARHAPQACAAVDAAVGRIAKAASVAAGIGLSPAPFDRETYCWFTRIYERDGDCLAWHFDNNFSNGRRFTYVQELDVSRENASHFLVQDESENIRVFVSKAGSAILYDGSSTKHAISRQAKGGRRVVLVVPLYEDYTHGFYGSMRRRAREIVYRQMRL